MLELDLLKLYFLYFRRGWIVSAIVPWMATRDSFQSQPPAFYNSKSFNRFISILAAQWMKATNPFGKNKRKRSLIKRKRSLIQFYQQQNNALHSIH